VGFQQNVRKRQAAARDDLNMKLSAQEEYGLRCLLRVASAGAGGSVTIPEIAKAEALSTAYVGKLMSVLRQGEFVESVRGQAGGYVLSRPPEKIAVAEVLASLGGRLFEPGFCDEFVGLERICTHSIDCSVRSLWRSVQHAVDLVLTGITLKDLLRKESEVSRLIVLRATKMG
jgi:Rrf2 family protein